MFMQMQIVVLPNHEVNVGKYIFFSPAWNHDIQADTDPERCMTTLRKTNPRYQISGKDAQHFGLEAGVSRMQK